MATVQHPPQPVLAASGSPPAHRALPDRSVDGASIEDAYTAFILYCNPAVPVDTDSAALREAFRTPPKSGGKSFSTYTLFELIKKLETKELKTWAELAVKLAGSVGCRLDEVDVLGWVVERNNGRPLPDVFSRVVFPDTQLARHRIVSQIRASEQ